MLWGDFIGDVGTHDDQTIDLELSSNHVWNQIDLAFWVNIEALLKYQIEKKTV